MPLSGARRDAAMIAKLRAALERVCQLSAGVDANQVKAQAAMYEAGQVAARCLQGLRGF